MNTQNEIVDLQERLKFGSLETLRRNAYEREGDPLLAALTDQNAQLQEAQTEQLETCRVDSDLVILEEVRQAKHAADVKVATIQTRATHLRGLLSVVEKGISNAPYHMLKPAFVHNPSKAQYIGNEMDHMMARALAAKDKVKREKFLQTAQKIAEVAAEEYDRDPLNPHPDYNLRRERGTSR